MARSFATIVTSNSGHPAMSRPLSAKASASLLRQKSSLKALFDETQRLSHLQQLVESQLQKAACKHCHVAAWRDGCLLLIVTDSQWATRLRYQQRRLQKQLQTFEEFANLTKILFKVQPFIQSASKLLPPARLSEQAAQSIQTTAEHVTDERLKAALERLARHTCQS